LDNCSFLSTLFGENGSRSCSSSSDKLFSDKRSLSSSSSSSSSFRKNLGARSVLLLLAVFASFVFWLDSIYSIQLISNFLKRQLKMKKTYHSIEWLVESTFPCSQTELY
jgi:hypothetical protein